MKAFSKEGLIAQAKLDPAERAKKEIVDWIGTTVDELSRQIEQTEAEMELVQGGNKKKKAMGEKMSELEELNERRVWHNSKLEIVQRMLENGQLQTDQVEVIQEDVKYFVEANAVSRCLLQRMSEADQFRRKTLTLMMGCTKISICKKRTSIYRIYPTTTTFPTSTHHPQSMPQKRPHRPSLPLHSKHQQRKKRRNEQYQPPLLLPNLHPGQAQKTHQVHPSQRNRSQGNPHWIVRKSNYQNQRPSLYPYLYLLPRKRLVCHRLGMRRQLLDLLLLLPPLLLLPLLRPPCQDRKFLLLPSRTNRNYQNLHLRSRNLQEKKRNLLFQLLKRLHP
jgi:hypothetical protein